jgi:hypothetical protein
VATVDLPAPGLPVIRKIGWRVITFNLTAKKIRWNNQHYTLKADRRPLAYSVAATNVLC